MARRQNTDRCARIARRFYQSSQPQDGPQTRANRHHCPAHVSEILNIDDGNSMAGNGFVGLFALPQRGSVLVEIPPTLMTPLHRELWDRAKIRRRFALDRIARKTWVFT